MFFEASWQKNVNIADCVIQVSFQSTAVFHSSPL